MKKLLLILLCLPMIGFGQVVISGTISNPIGDTVKFIAQKDTYTTTLMEDNHFAIILPIDTATYLSFLHGEESTGMYLKGGESINLTIDTEFFHETIIYEGSAESSYLAKKFMLNEKADIYGQLFTLEKEEFITNLNKHIENIEQELTSVNNEAFLNSEKENNVKMVEYYLEKIEAIAKLPKIGEPAIDFTYPDKDGNKFSLSSFKSSLVYVDVWATWCGPCKTEIPALKELKHDYQNNNITFLSVSVDTDKEAWLKMVADKQLGGVQLWANGWSAITKSYAINHIPRSMLFDGNGNVISLDAPRPSSDEIRGLIDAAGVDIIVDDTPGNINTEISAAPSLIMENVKFNDPNNNNTIEANEYVSLEFDLKNEGKGKAQNIEILIEDLNSISGIDYKKTYKLSSLASGDNKKIRIPIRASIDINTGKANFTIKILEGNGFDADPFNFLITTQSFIPPKLEIVDSKFSSDYGQIKVGKTASVQFVIQNTGQGVAEDINIKINIPDNIFATGAQEYELSTLGAGEVKQYDFEFLTNKRYTKSSVTIDAIISEKFNKYGTSVSMKEQIGKSISSTIVFNPQSTVKQNTIDIKRFSLTSHVDKNIPTNKKVNKRFALVIGNEDYASYQSGLQNEQNVDYAERDATIFKQYCLNTFGVKSENMFSITNATSGMMSQEIKKVIKLTELEGKDAELIIYYAGHGFPDDQKVPHLIPVDVSGGDLSRAINLQELYKDLGNLKAKKVTVFLDACFTGGGRESGLMASRGVKVKLKEGSLGGSLVVFSASSGDQSSLPFNKEKHGVFTYHLLKAFQEAEGDISYGNLYDAINIEVNKTTLRNQGMEQNPKVNTSSKVINDWRNWKF